MPRIHNKGIITEISHVGLERIKAAESLASNWLVKHVDKGATDVYLQRHASCTQSILDYYSGQELHMPSDVCPARFRTELEYWGVDEDDLEECCRKTFVSYFQELELLAVLDNGERSRHEERQRVTAFCGGKGWKAVQAKIFAMMEYPDSSVLAKLYLYVSNLLILMSLVVLIFKTHSVFQRKLNTDEWHDFLTPDEEEIFSHNFDYNHARNSSNQTYLYLEEFFNDIFVHMDFLTYLNLILLAYFSIELLCRVIFFPLKMVELFTFFNVMDALAVSVMYATLIADEINDKERYQESIHDAIYALQVVRCFRLFRLVRHIDGFRVMAYTMKASLLELCMVLLGVFIAVTIFGSLAYFSTESAFKNIPDAMWWAIITITTVGYGDVYPTTVQGKLLACACAISGICLLAVLIPVLVNNFTLFSSHYAFVKIKYKNNVVKGKTKIKPEKSYKF